MILNLIAIIFTLPAVESYCYSKTYYATTTTKSIWETYYSNYDSCTLTIKPSSYYSSNYYLEIKWQLFDIKGDMPYCSNDYVEVFLKRDYKSIGKFCSNNLVGSNLFNMYSPDGYAKIKFRSDGSKTGKGFKLTYRLRSISSDYLGYMYSDCSTENMYFSSDILYSSKWPKEYAEDGTCKYQISKEGTKKIIFMDLSLRRSSTYYCNSFGDDTIEIRGAKKSGESFIDATQLRGPFCGTSSIVTYTSSYRYILVLLKRQKDLRLRQSSERGFVAGYVTYTTGSSSAYKFPVGVVIGISVTLIVLIIGGIIACIVCRKKARTPAQRRPIATSQGQAPVTYGHPSSTAYPSTTTYPTMHTAYPGAPVQAGYQVPSPYEYSKPVSQVGYQGAVPYPMEAPPPYSATYDAPTANQGEAATGIPATEIPTTGVPTTAVTTAPQPSYNPTYVQPYPTAGDQR